MSLSDSSNSSRGDNLLLVHERKMVWSSSSDPEASASDQQIVLRRDSDAESASREDPSRFDAREDAIANVARDQDLPDDPEAVLSRRRTRPPAADEARGSDWQDAPEPVSVHAVKAEEVFYDPMEAAKLLQMALQGIAGPKKKRRAIKVKKPDPPGSTLCTDDSLRDLRAQFDFSEGVELRLPTPNERADDPPEGLRVIGGFPCKDERYTDHFLYVALDDYSVPEDCLGMIVRKWRKIGLRALRLLHGAPCRSSLESSDHPLDYLIEMQGAAQSLRAKKAAEKKAAKEKAALEANFRPPIPLEAVIDPEDKVALANLIASCSDTPLPAPEALLEAERYFETETGFLRAFTSMNSMVRAYDSATRKCELSREQLEMARAEAETKIADANTAKQRAKASASAEKVERLKAAENSLTARRRLEAEVERLRRAAKKEFGKKVGAIEAKMDQYGKVSERYLFLVQARANAELIADLEEGKRVEDEKDEVLHWKADYGDAEEEYIRLVTELREDLKLPPASPDSVNDSFGNRSIEGTAAGRGVAEVVKCRVSSWAWPSPKRTMEFRSRDRGEFRAELVRGRAAYVPFSGIKLPRNSSCKVLPNSRRAFPHSARAILKDFAYYEISFVKAAVFDTGVVIPSCCVLGVNVFLFSGSQLRWRSRTSCRSQERRVSLPWPDAAWFCATIVHLLTPFAYPFSCGYRGVDLPRRIPHLSQNPSNLAEMNCDPLSVTISADDVHGPAHERIRRGDRRQELGGLVDSWCVPLDPPCTSSMTLQASAPSTQISKGACLKLSSCPFLGRDLSVGHVTSDSPDPFGVATVFGFGSEVEARAAKASADVFSPRGIRVNSNSPNCFVRADINASFSATLLVASKFSREDCSRISPSGDAKRIPKPEPCFEDEPSTWRIQIASGKFSRMFSGGSPMIKSAKT
ncbi:hypothetical protein ISN44_As07g010880 [Arabidopsis suecica]|uniref:Uncharacterized protein n=1 Tax=Arabidopsis suecica TaxID=45249 RepID=A0A8T2BRY1_ARASU|nr:hypothetical protein ISN44_As07g010880 [Arabidopsis suecica]